MNEGANSNISIDFYEQNFRIKNLTSRLEHADAYRLRHKVFVEELKWVPPQEDGLEIDKYDGEGMVPLGVFNEAGTLIAHLRITLPHKTFMMEKEFAELIAKPIVKTDYTAEVSRVCTTADIRSQKIGTPFGKYHISMLLYKGLYSWCIQNFIREVCMVVETKLCKLLRIVGFPCERIGETKIMPDGVSAVAVRVDWHEFAIINKRVKPQLFAWFEEGEILASQPEILQLQAMLHGDSHCMTSAAGM